MGLCNSPSSFQRLVDIAFRPLINKFLVCYIDDLNIYSNNHEEHLEHIRRVFECCRVAQLTFNPSKCKFFKTSLKFLGYIVTSEGLKTDPVKLEKIANLPLPKTITDVRSFIGICSYYRRFVPNFAAIARPLHEQTKKENKKPWSEETTLAFETLKKALITAPVLMRPDFSKEFVLVTDASIKGLSCILTQLDDKGCEHPIAYLSRAVNKEEANYGISKLECLAVIFGVKACRPYLLGNHFTIITDHSAIKGLLNTKNPSRILMRWINLLSEYRYTVKYRPGRVNESADFLSRLGY